jgi:hypothetical protein
MKKRPKKLCKESTKQKAGSLGTSPPKKNQKNKIDSPLANLTKMRREENQNQKQKRGDNNKHQGNPGNH